MLRRADDHHQHLEKVSPEAIGYSKDAKDKLCRDLITGIMYVRKMFKLHPERVTLEGILTQWKRPEDRPTRAEVHQFVLTRNALGYLRAITAT
ncbi:hypothetical protein GV64_14860 [Endozoicomonas elysicola]|uniref:Uncharacterized protein n=1 Tax=Endozoicomonas elysicola TaxID=305900 RepID=A0A081KCH1_9GAMM|nr:hypothetical protein GV64_14860 [Endozoicomonas elysicola]